MFTYNFKLKSDNGTYRFKTVAQNKKIATEMICKAEGCPKSAILEVKRVKKVVKKAEPYRKKYKVKIIDLKL